MAPEVLTSRGAATGRRGSGRSSDSTLARRMLPAVEWTLVLTILALPWLDLALGDRLWILGPLASVHVYLSGLPAVLGLVVLASRTHRRRHRALVLAVLGFGLLHVPHAVPVWSSPAVGPTLRLMTWNVQATRGETDVLLSAIDRADPDVLALQEVVSERAAPDGLLVRLRERGWTCEFEGYFAERRWSGIALCATEAVEIRRSVRRTYHERGRWSYLFSELEIRGRVVNLVIPHFLAYRIREEDPWRRPALFLERVSRTVRWHRQEATALLDLVSGFEDPTFLVGDFNSTPWQAMHLSLRRRFRDAWATKGTGFGSTFRFFVPLRIDFVYVPPRARVVRVETGSFGSSDHRPVVAEVELSSLDSR